MIEGPSMFRKSFLKYLKTLSAENLEKFGISENLKNVLFNLSSKVSCVLCQKKVQVIKLHLFSFHEMNERMRKQHWDTFSDQYSEQGLVFADIV